MARQVDVRIDGLSRVLRALRDFPPEASAALRDEAQSIAANIMAPAYRDAAASVPSWGPTLSAAVRARRDRIPSVTIGGARPKVSGGATPTMLRWPTNTGDAGESGAPFQQTNWIQRAKGYKGEAMEKWGDALTRVVNEWNRGL